MMRRVLLISPHFPPDATAGTHRVRLLAPYLAQWGWDPTVLTCDVNAYEGTLDPALASMVPSSLRIVRASALPVKLTRLVGFGDLGLRSLFGLYRAARQLLERERFDAIFITIFPAYTAVLGPLLARRFAVPFVLDYQDPWVSAWGRHVGGGSNGGADFKSRASRWLAELIEPRVVRAASAITAVSPGTYEPILSRNPDIQPLTAAIPIGADRRDFVDALSRADAAAPVFDHSDGRIHICYTGTILPLGYETLSALLRAVRLIRDRQPDLYRRLQLHFIGTSNQTVFTNDLKVVPRAREIGVDDVVHEVPTRLPYSQVVGLQARAAILLALGSSEHHYTASKIFPLLLARRPLLAIYHRRSTVTDLLSTIARGPSVNLVTYGDDDRAESKVEHIYRTLTAIASDPRWSDGDVDGGALGEYLAESLAGRLASVFDQVVVREAA